SFLCEAVESPTQARNATAPDKRRDELVLAHLPMVRHIIGKLVGHLPAGVDVENLESAGALGLIEAATNFDHDPGNQFKTYAYIRIRGAVLDELRRNCPCPSMCWKRWPACAAPTASCSRP